MLFRRASRGDRAGLLVRGLLSAVLHRLSPYLLGDLRLCPNFGYAGSSDFNRSSAILERPSSVLRLAVHHLLGLSRSHGVPHVRDRSVQPRHHLEDRDV